MNVWFHATQPYNSRVKFGFRSGYTIIYQDVKGFKGAQLHRKEKNRTMLSFTKLFGCMWAHQTLVFVYVRGVTAVSKSNVYFIAFRKQFWKEMKKRVIFYVFLFFNENQLNKRGNIRRIENKNVSNIFSKSETETIKINKKIFSSKWLASVVFLTIWQAAEFCVNIKLTAIPLLGRRSRSLFLTHF